MNKINWEFVDSVTLAAFAAGIISDKNFYAKYKCGENGGQVRNLLRSKGVDKARELARRAFNRRKKNKSCEVLLNLS